MNWLMSTSFETGTKHKIDQTNGRKELDAVTIFQETESMWTNEHAPNDDANDTGQA